MEFIEDIQQKRAKIWSECHMTLTMASINHTGNASHNSHKTQTAVGSSIHARIILTQSLGFKLLQQITQKKKNTLYFSYIRFYRFLSRINFIVQTSFRTVFLLSAWAYVWKVPEIQCVPTKHYVIIRRQAFSRSGDRKLGAWHQPIHDLPTHKVPSATVTLTFQVPILPLFTLLKPLGRIGVGIKCFVWSL